MYIKGRNWICGGRSAVLTVQHRDLAVVIGLLIYIDRKGTIFTIYFFTIPKPHTFTDIFIYEAQGYAVEGKYTQALLAYDQAIGGSSDPSKP
jgi:hypothetical protein